MLLEKDLEATLDFTDGHAEDEGFGAKYFAGRHHMPYPYISRCVCCVFYNTCKPDPQ